MGNRMKQNPPNQMQLNPRQSKLLTLIQQSLKVILVTDEGDEECEAMLFDTLTGLFLCLKEDYVIGFQREKVKKVIWSVDGDAS